MQVPEPVHSTLWRSEDNQGRGGQGSNRKEDQTTKGEIGEVKVKRMFPEEHSCLL